MKRTSQILRPRYGSISTDGNSVSINVPPILSLDGDLPLANFPLFERAVALPDGYFPSVTHTFEIEGSADDGGVDDGDGSFSDFTSSSDRFPVSADYEEIIDARYGEAAKLADWRDIKKRYQEEGGDFLRDAGMSLSGDDGPRAGMAVTVGGDRFLGGDRHYFFTWGDVHSGFASHDIARFDGVPLHLGSWFTPRYLFVDLTEEAGGGDSGASFISGRIHGDPHLETLDGLAYDFQAAGEFILIETESGAENPFQVQTRFEPWKGSDVVSVTTRMAVEVGDHVVEIDAIGPDKILLDPALFTRAC